MQVLLLQDSVNLWKTRETVKIVYQFKITREFKRTREAGAHRRVRFEGTRRDMGDVSLSKDIRNRCRLRHPLETPDRAGDTSQARRQLAPIVAIYFSKNGTPADATTPVYRRKSPLVS